MSRKASVVIFSMNLADKDEITGKILAYDKKCHPSPRATEKFTFARIQSAIKHLGSYSISEHPRWVIVIAPLLRVWLSYPLGFLGCCESEG
jgi:hypothetical protein